MASYLNRWPDEDKSDWTVEDWIYEDASLLARASTEVVGAPHAAGARNLLQVLLRHTFMDGQDVEMSLSALADECGISTRTVSRGLRALEVPGLVTVVVRGGGSDESQYRVDVDRLRACAVRLAAKRHPES